MNLFLKSTSTAVHHYQEHTQTVDIDTHETSTYLTVWTKSLVFSCTGFTVVQSPGTLAFRVDNYVARPDEITLMDGSGNPVFTLCRRKKLRLLEYWLVYEGEMGKYSSKSSKKPVFCARRNTSIGQAKQNVLAYVYGGISDKRCMYSIEGSYTRRSCKILEDSSRRVVGEIKKKESMVGGATFGSEVFHLVVESGFGSGLAMVIVVLLHHMFS